MQLDPNSISNFYHGFETTGFQNHFIMGFCCCCCIKVPKIQQSRGDLSSHVLFSRSWAQQPTPVDLPVERTPADIHHLATGVSEFTSLLS